MGRCALLVRAWPQGAGSPWRCLWGGATIGRVPAAFPRSFPSPASWLRWLLAAALVVGGAFAQDEARLLPAFQKLWKAKKDKPVPVAEQLAGLGTLRGLDSPAVADALVVAWLAVEVDVATADAAREEASAEMARIVKGQETVAQRTFPQEQFKRFHELKDLVPQLRVRCDELRDLQQRVGNRIADLRRKDSLLFLLTKVLPGKKHPVPLRLAAARAIGGGAESVLPEVAAALERAREPEEQLALIDAMGLAGVAATAHATPVITMLQAKDEAVRERAALALAKIAVPEAVGPMLQLLATAEGQTKLRIAAALEVLTGQQFGSNVGAWQSWWQAEGAAVRAGQQPLGGGTPSHRKETDRNYYFGIPQDQSSSILYVIDCSGSMTAPIKLKGAGATAGGGVAKETTRLEGCKQELIRALGLLNPKQKFAILYYNDLPHFWQPKPQLAEKAVVEQAQAFVRTLQPSSTTNIHDSLEQGFKLVGRGVRDRFYGVELDTIFLLTDGSPTTTDGKPDSTEKIILAVRSWNPLQRVTIHTIGIGGELNDNFLGQLARENGGEYKKF